MKLKNKILSPKEAIEALNNIRCTFEMWSQEGNPNAKILLKHLPSHETIDKIWEMANNTENKQTIN
ncbi:MAG: hypothetical protein LBI03_01170 [Clostridiales bacterium]|jgi:hypothetical protein|nr:hypothetical protein [Clostridiales bacterium]